MESNPGWLGIGYVEEARTNATITMSGGKLSTFISIPSTDISKRNNCYMKKQVPYYTN